MKSQSSKPEMEGQNRLLPRASFQGNLNMQNSEQTIAAVKDYYGQVLKSKHDLKTTACCTSDSFSPEVRQIVGLLHQEVLEKSYGCGIPIPESLSGCRVLDLGCGAGRDVFILSKLVGAEGFVYGVDMTDEQLFVARNHLEAHIHAFGYTRPNIEFRQGYMEDLDELGFESDSLDLVISNCVFNLSPAKQKLFQEIFRVLKPGGELYFSDVFCDRRLPLSCQHDPILLGECLGGAMYFEDFRRLLFTLGIADFRVVKSNPIDVTDEQVKAKVGQARFHSVTVRAFKLDLEDKCEDYGQAVTYKGTIPGHPHSFALDDHHLFEKDRFMTVCSNTAAMVSCTRFQPHFEVYGDGRTHYGLFPCDPVGTSHAEERANGSCC